MLVAVVDRAGRGGIQKVKRTFEEVQRKYTEEGHRLRWPVSAEIVHIPIMGASKSLKDRHTLFVSVRAVESGVLDGLIAHELGHMFRTEEEHASHDPEVYRQVGQEVRIPRPAEAAFSQAFNHVQDIYADDLAFIVLESVRGRMYEFFAAWIEGNLQSQGKNRWQNVALAVTNGFAIGNLVRHGLIASDDPLWERARGFDRSAGFSAVDLFAEFYANLPESPSAAVFIGEVKGLANLMTKVVGA
ncbi:MAG TPA: DUF5781 family protein [Thermoplasmata archaeon]|nr:DUF5781 family protein [Thermoplasmata archaeon]